MASESTQGPMNGTYHAHHHPNHYTADPYHAHVPSNTASATSVQPASDSKNEIPKDEVGWFFVEQYYTTLSRSPEKLHLFYSRHSKFVSGLEAQKVTVAVGQKAINERIAELDFQDCKVRVLNVDSQASFENILVSVIGEISNKAEPPRKFVQTFVLAEQPNGYYVLNDIFRYLADEDEEVVEEAPAAEAAAAPEPEAPVEAVKEPEATEPAAPEAEPEVEKPAAVEPEVEAEVNGEADAEEDTPQTNGASTQEQAAAPAPAIPSPAAPAAAESKPEEPKQEEPAQAAAPAAAPTKAAPPAPAKAAPMTWASIARKTDSTAPVATPAPAAAPAVPATQPKVQPPAQAATPPAASTETTTAQVSSNDNAGWQTAGAEHSKKQSRPQSVSATGDDHVVSAFVKNVNEKVDASLLKQNLARFGKLKYFDVNRQKNCAFVEFADVAGYNRAVAANPHQIGGEQVTVEERRPRSTAYGGGAGFGPGRGGHRGRVDNRSASQGRGGGFQKESGRGGFTPRGRGGGGNVTPKGRSQAQAA